MNPRSIKTPFQRAIRKVKKGPLLRGLPDTASTLNPQSHKTSWQALWHLHSTPEPERIPFGNVRAPLVIAMARI